MDDPRGLIDPTDWCVVPRTDRDQGDLKAVKTVQLVLGRPVAAAVAAAALTGVLCAFSVPLPLAAQSNREEIASVDFVGNEAFSDTELRRAVLTRASSCPFILAVTTCALGIEWGRDRSYYSPRNVGYDVANLTDLYRAHGFRSIDIQSELEQRGDSTVAVTFRINEGFPFRVGSIDLAGDPLPPGLDPGEAFRIDVGDPLSFLLLQATTDSLTLRLRNQGYASAEVFSGFFRAAQSDRASVTYRVELGPLTTFGPIRVSGNELLASGVILDRLPFREGELFRESRILEAQRSLHELDIVARAVVRRDTARIESDSVMPIIVELVEGDAHRVRMELGINSAECFNFEGRWTSRNFFGEGRTLQARARVSNLLASTLQSTVVCAQAGEGDYGRVNWLAGIDFNQPSLFSPRMNLLVGVFAERQSLKNIFVRRGFGVDVSLSRTLGTNSFMNVRFRPQLNQLEAAEVTLCATFLACSPEDIEVLSGNRWLSPVALSLNRDATDDIFSPTRGYRVLLDLELADPVTGSDYAYRRAFADGSLYRAIDPYTVVAVRARTGHISPGSFAGTLTGTDGAIAEIVPSEKRFYGGGANSLRGFAQSSLGPRSLSIPVEELLRRSGPSEDPACTPFMVLDLTCDGTPLAGSDLYQLRPIGGLATFEANAELRFRLTDGLLGGVAFVDVGQVWRRTLSFDGLELSPGIGLRYTTPFGPLRFDVAYSFRDREALQVVTSQIRPFDPSRDDDSDRINIAPGDGQAEYIDWVVSDNLALLDPRVLFGDEPGFSLRRFQLHFSIGQAF
ncbi:MAG: BamA/TamA family outer membrane protein [Gemmatimonadetes bacterium]|nr:BamA/TamA family outer membrane protein [Gemmatimonadota bacterium]MYA63066.1 BamA/TamA family outer membrane protein [Gemmatimonadota bacterium]MYC00155.1 BamA/TamA family outer membrane protein [Gemmatimonadota bacterium]MYH53769.1 BamA/TamA family outer membrane protein [Gemmatimonadota bacterium]MYK66072.1 BamA/TamA family outer membrane protein [Gemmatimonadota bacterium]